MRSPSSRVLANRVALSRYTPSRSTDGGAVAGYTPIGEDVPCSVQPDDPERIFDGESLKVTEASTGHVVFSADYGLGINDLIVWVDASGQSRNLHVNGVSDQAGRGAAFIARYEERQR